MASEPVLSANMQGFVLVMFRVLGVFLRAPVVSVPGIPTRVKVGLGFFVAVVLWPTLGSPDAVPLSLLPMVGAVIRETLVGAVMGMVARLVITSVEIAASVMGLEIGFRAGNVVNPFTALPTSALEELYFVMASLLYLALDGHHVLLRALARSFEVIPLGASVHLSGNAAWHLSALVAQSLAIGVKMAMPVLAVAFMMNVALALLARAVPQMQVFFLGMPVKFALGMATVLLAFPAVAYLLRALIADMPLQIDWLMRAL